MKLARVGIMVSVALCAVAAACAQADGNAKGGEITDAGLQAVTPGDFIDPNALPGQDAGCGEGGTWPELYADIFGQPGKVGSCVFNASCHGTPGTEAQEKGIICMDQEGCRLSWIEQGALNGATKAKPENSIFLKTTLRHYLPDGGKKGIMPQMPTTYAYPDACMERIKQWIAMEAPPN